VAAVAVLLKLADQVLRRSEAGSAGRDSDSMLAL